MSSALNGPDTVTGASGHLGSQVIESIVAITRAPGKRLAVQCRGSWPNVWMHLSASATSTRAAAVAFLDVATGDVAELTGQAPQSVRSYLPANNPALAG